MSAGTGNARAAIVAYVTAATNALAGLAMLVLLRPGVPPGEPDPSARLEHVSTNAVAWRLGWLTWNVAAITLLAFFVVLALRWRRRAPVLAPLAALLAAAGLAADVGAETMLMIVAPTADPAAFRLVEDVSYALTGYLGNGLYTVAGAALTVAGSRELPRTLVWHGALVWTAGAALSGSTLLGSEAGQFASTAVLMPLFVAWTVLVGRWLQTRGS